MSTSQTINPKNLSSDQLASIKAMIEAEQGERSKNVEKLTKEFRSFVTGSAARMQETLAAFQSASPAPAAANGNGPHKATPKKARAVKTVTAKRKPRQAYRVPDSDKIWKGYGPAPKSLKALPKAQWGQYAVQA